MSTDYDAIADVYQKASSHPIKEYIESYTFLKYLGEMNGKSALDLACGEGYYTRLIKNQGAGHVAGVDISKAMIEQARAVEAETPLGIEYHVHDVTTLGRIGGFDMTSAVYLFPYAATETMLTAMLQTAFDNLKPGGKLVAITLNPNLQAKDAMIYPPYGVKITTTEKIQDGDKIGFTIEVPNTANNTFELHVTFWGQSAIETAARAVGFNNLEWQPLEMSKEGLEKYPRNHWQAFLDKPFSMILICTK